MVKIALFCNAGMSTSMLVVKMEKAAKERNINPPIKAYPEAQLLKHLEGTDVVLLGPQLKFLFQKIKIECDKKSIPCDVIRAVDYGMMNGEKVLDYALKLANKS
jgi:cellobiose PTS system EIIB component